MKVRISTLPPQGRKFSEKLPLDPLNSRLAKAQSNDLKFMDDPLIDITLTPAGNGAHLTGKLKGRYQQPCRRCLEPIEVKCEPILDLMLQPEGSRSHDPEEEIDDEGVVYFEGESVDLEDILQESLILSTSPYGPEHPNCPATDAFIATRSGTNLGELLAAAQRKKVH